MLTSKKNYSKFFLELLSYDIFKKIFNNILIHYLIFLIFSISYFFGYYILLIFDLNSQNQCIQNTIGFKVYIIYIYI